jgi:hypothetical protein
MQHRLPLEHAARTYSMDKKEAARACSRDMQHGHVPGTCTWEMQQELAAWTCTRDMHHGHAAWTCNLDMQQRHTTWTFSNGTQQGHIIKTCSVEPPHGHGHAAIMRKLFMSLLHVNAMLHVHVHAACLFPC